MKPRAILPGIGFGSIRFGMEEHEVSFYLGDPDETEVQDYGEGGQANVLYYDELGISISFDKEEDYKLVEISFDSDNFILYDKISVGMSKDDFLQAIKDLKLGEYSHEDISDEGYDDKELYTFDDININFWLDDNALSSIQVGPKWLDDETIEWPHSYNFV